jgi:hypothetical protein
MCADLPTAPLDRAEGQGETSDTSLDFRTGLGQLSSTMDDEETVYGLAMPDTARVERLRGQVARSEGSRARSHSDDLLRIWRQSGLEGQTFRREDSRMRQRSANRAALS